MKQAVFIINSLRNGGAERVVATQANYMQRSGYSVTILLLHRGIQYELEPGVRTVFLTDKESFGVLEYGSALPGLAARIGRELDATAQRGELVLVTAHLLFPHLVARCSRYAAGTIYVQHCVQGIVPYAHSLWYRSLLRWMYGGKQIVAVSNAVAEELQTVYGIRTPSVRAIYNPLDFAEIDRKMTEPVTAPRPFFLFCGRLTAQKRPERAIEAFYRGGFCKRYDLVILGEGELRESLEKQAETCGISEYVHFEGWQDNVYKWMHAASLLLLTSDWEGLGMVLAEALSCGCPVVSVRCPGPTEVLTGPLARYLCEPDAESIVRTIQTALESYPENLRRFTADLAVEKNVRSYLDAYQEWNRKS